MWWASEVNNAGFGSGDVERSSDLCTLWTCFVFHL